MPVRVDETPVAIRALLAHGITFNSIVGTEAVGTCPWCGSDKFYVDTGTTQWECKKGCGSGNVYQFMTRVWKESHADTPESAYEGLASSKGLPIAAIREWGVCKSFITGEWIIPGYGAGGGIVNLYRYLKLGGKFRFVPTPSEKGEGHGIFKATGERFSDSVGEIHIMEGPWDGIAWYDVCKAAKRTNTAILAVPGCNVWKASWSKFTSGKEVTVFFDNDYPKTTEKTKVTSQPAWTGLQSIVGHMSSVVDTDQPKSVSFLSWAGDDVVSGYSKDYEDGCDVRDLLGKGGKGVEDILGMVRTVPPEWSSGKAVVRGSGKHIAMDSIPCESWRKLTSAWKKALSWNKGLEGALCVMLAAVASVKHRGDKLWFKVISPASGGKTTLCEAIGVARKYVVMESSINGFYSGYKTDKDGEKDHSLAARLFDKTLVTKDADTLLKNPNREMILSQMRDIYDAMGGKSFNNGVKRDYQGLIFTLILAGTPAIRELDASELGQRCLDYVVMDKIDSDAEDDMIMRAVYQQIEDTRVTNNCKVESTMNESIAFSSKMTGGYAEYLRRTSEEGIKVIEFGDKEAYRCGRLAKFVAHMRSRPPKSEEEDGNRELGMRLSKQLSKLAHVSAYVMNKTSVDTECMKLVEKVAFDTARGLTLDLVRMIYSSGNLGIDLKEIAKRMPKCVKFLAFLVKIEVLEMFENGKPSLARQARWRLTKGFSKLYKEVMRSKI